MSFHLIIFYLLPEGIRAYLVKISLVATTGGGAYPSARNRRGIIQCRTWNAVLTECEFRQYNLPRFYVPSSVPNPNNICIFCIIGVEFATFSDAGWSSLVARRAHNPKVVGSNPAPATTFPESCFSSRQLRVTGAFIVDFEKNSPGKHPTYKGSVI